MYTNDDSLTINAQVNPVSYISDRINYLSATASLTFELTRVRDNLPTEVTLNFEGTEMAQTNVSAIDLTNGEEFIIKNFRYTDSLEFVDTFNEPISVLAGIEPELIIGSNRINKALMNIDIHYDSNNYIQNHVQLLHSSVPTTFEENKLNNLIKGAYKVDALLLEYTQTPQSDV